MIYLKLKKDIMTLDEAIKNYHHKKMYHLKAFNRCIKNTLKQLNYDIDIYIDIKNTCFNPLGFFCCGPNNNKYKRYNRINEKYFIVIFLHRIFNYVRRRNTSFNQINVYGEFKKILYHELIHYKRRLQLNNNIIDIMQYKKHDKVLPGCISQNNIDILKSELLRG